MAGYALLCCYLEVNGCQKLPVGQHTVQEESCLVLVVEHCFKATLGSPECYGLIRRDLGGFPFNVFKDVPPALQCSIVRQQCRPFRTYNAAQVDAHPPDFSWDFPATNHHEVLIRFLSLLSLLLGFHFYCSHSGRVPSRKHRHKRSNSFLYSTDTRCGASNSVCHFSL